MLNLERKPVGEKFLPLRPEGINRINSSERTPTVTENLQDDNIYRSWRSSGIEDIFKRFENRLSQLHQEMVD